MPPSNNQNHIGNESVAVWYQAILNRYNSTSNANNAIDSKSSVILAVAGAIAVFAAERLAEHIGVLGVIGLIGMVATGVIILISINLKEVAGEVNSTADRPGYYINDDHNFLFQLIKDLETSLNKLQELNAKKARLYKATTIIFAAASAILLVSVFIDFNLSLQVISRS